MFFLILLILFISAAWILYRVTFSHRIALSESFQGPPLTPVVGNALAFFKVKPEEVLDRLGDLTKKYGGLFRLWIGPFNCSFVSTNPRDVEVILNSTKHIKKSGMYEMLIPWLGDGLLLSYGKKWYNRRKILTPAFHYKILDGFLDTFKKNTRILRDLLLVEVPENRDRIVDIHPWINSCTLDIICETAMGIELQSQTNKELPYSKAVVRISEIIWTRWMEKMWMRFDVLFKCFGFRLYREHEACLRTLHEFTDNIIRKRRQKVQSEKNAQGGEDKDEDADHQLGIRKKQALLDVLLKATIKGVPLTDEEIREEVDTFMFEGHDTTTSAIGFTLHLISKDQRVQDKMFQEINEVLGAENDAQNWSYSELGNLKYMEMCIKEALRLFPPVAFLGRRIEEDFVLNGKTIPAKSNLGIGVYQMGRDENLFQDPLRFHPERFESSALDPFAFIAWSFGPRDCIGKKFSLLEIKNVLVMILRNFQLFDANFKPVVVAQVVLRSKNGIQIGMRRRNRRQTQTLTPVPAAADK